MRIQVNGELRVVSPQVSLPELLDSLAIPPDRVAIELNERVIRRTEWPQAILQDGDKIEIVYFVGGGTDNKSR
jgi:thiamine biosynthesis protein ThiS